MIWSIVARETRTKAQLERLQARLASKASRDEKSVELGELTLPPLAALCGRNGLEEGRERTSVAARLCIALRKGLRTKLWRRQSPQAWKCGRRREWRYVGEQCRRLRRYVTSTASVAVKSAVVSRLPDALGPVATAKLTGEAKLPELCARTVPALKTLCETRLQSGAP
jgi:hypothetical protein